MPESHSDREALAILWNAEYCHTYVELSFVKLNFQKTDGKKLVEKKKLSRSVLHLVIYNRLYYTDMNWRYITLLLSNCKGSFIAEQELQQLLASLMLRSPIARKLGWQVTMAFSFCSEHQQQFLWLKWPTWVGLLLNTHRKKYTGDKHKSLEFYSSTQEV